MLLQNTITAFRIRVQRPGPWIVALSLPVLILFLAWTKVGAALPRQPLQEVAMASGSAWPFLVFLAPSAWQWTGDAGVRASWFRGLGQIFALSILIALPISTLVQGLSYGEFSYWADHLLGMSLLCAVAGVPLGRIQTSTERLALKLEETARRAAHSNWLAKGDPFSPALLFQSLETFADQAIEHPHAVEQGLVELAELYRAWLDQSQRSVATLGEERRLAERLIALARHRDPFLNVDWRWEPGADALRVPPLLLQPPVEAAIEAVQGGNGSIRIEATSQGRCTLVVESNKPLSCPTWPVLGERLRYLHGDEAWARTQSTPNGWRFMTCIPGGSSWN